MTDNELLMQLLTEVKEIKTGQTETNTRLDKIEANIKEMTTDIKHIKEQVDVVYDWVDRVDLRVKALE